MEDGEEEKNYSVVTSLSRDTKCSMADDKKPLKDKHPVVERSGEGIGHDETTTEREAVTTLSFCVWSR